MSAVPERIVVIGHPFSTLGMGGQARSCVSALQSVGAPVEVLDVYGNAARTDMTLRKWLEPIETTDPNNAVRVFHVNGDEIARVVDMLELQNNFRWDAGPTIICPAWELPHYPAEWADLCSRFTRCWGISKFVTESLQKAVSIPVDWVGQTIDTSSAASLPRRYFGIRESSHVFLTFFDFSSYVKRKNPHGTYEAFRRAFPRNSLQDVQLVIKAAGKQPEDDPLFEQLKADPRVKLITQRLNTLEMDSLLSCADTLVSLHRAEGFGRGPAEALIRGKQVVATAYSGTEDYLTDDNAFRIPYADLALEEGDYPHWQGQTWAEPHVDKAAEALLECAAKPDFKRNNGGTLDVLAACGPRSVGNRMLTAIHKHT